MLAGTAIRALKPAAREFKRSDSGGLHLLVKPTGAKLWRRLPLDDKQKTLADATWLARWIESDLPSLISSNRFYYERG